MNNMAYWIRTSAYMPYQLHVPLILLAEKRTANLFLFYIIFMIWFPPCGGAWLQKFAFLHYDRYLFTVESRPFLICRVMWRLWCTYYKGLGRGTYADRDYKLS